MLIDARELADGAVVEADLCVVGAGAAGISIARELTGSKLRVCLLEGGGQRLALESQALYDGSCDPPLSDAYLRASRLRFLGGTTNHWLGFCRPLDDIDFERRDWVPYSGWPFGAATLAPFYERAAGVCRIAPTLAPTAPVLPETDCRLLTTPFRVRATRFGIEYRDQLAAAPEVELYLHANVVNIGLRRNGGSVERLRVATAAGRRLTVLARCFVLAMGGVENARMLLVSDDVHGGGIGNRQDLVGRFFMDHPVFPVGTVCVSGDGSPWTQPLADSDWHGYRVTDAEQRRRRILNCSLAFGRVPEVEDSREQLLTEGAWRAIAGFLEGRQDDGTAAARSAETGGLYSQGFAIRPEQAPNPESRVTLGGELDPFGNRRPHLQWRLSELELATARESLAVLARDAGRFGLGRVRREPSVLLEAAYSPGFHHMGTTRMHVDPGHGVVDPDCRVHGVDNLYIAGSSVFPTSGYANPTLTLVALALRLGDHLRERLR